MRGTSSRRVVPGDHILSQQTRPFGLIEQLESRRLLSAAVDTTTPVPAPAPALASSATVVPSVHIGYLIPSNRTPQANAVPKIQGLIRRMQDWYRQQMEQHGFGARTFNVITEADGVTPKVEIYNLAQTDSYIRGDGTDSPGITMWGRVQDAAAQAGVPLWTPGQVWFLVTEAQEMLPDGKLLGGIALGYGHASGNGPGLGMIGSAAIPIMDQEDLADTRKYDGLIIPEIGPYPLKQNVTFVDFEGTTVAEVASSWQGAAWHELSHGFGFGHNFVNEVDGGNLMGNGLRSIRGNFFPELFPSNYTRLSRANALAANVSRYFHAPATWTDNTAPTLISSTDGAVKVVDGRIRIDINIADDTALSAVHLDWQGHILSRELHGARYSGSFETSYFTPGVSNEYVLSIYDAQGNITRRSIVVSPEAGKNVAPRPHFSILPGKLFANQTASLSAGALDIDGPGPLTYEWDFNGDGIYDTAPSTSGQVTHTFAGGQTYLVRVRATDALGASGVAEPIAIRPLDAPVQQAIYVSDLNWTTATSPFSGIRKDASTGGNALRIAGQTFAKGLGVHSPSEVVYTIGGKYTRFTAMVGIDDETGNAASDGTAVFQVFGDGKLLKQSTRRTGADGAEYLDVHVTGVQELRLVTTTGGDNDYKDHADWADARLHATSAPPVVKPTVSIARRVASLVEGQQTAFDLTRTGDTSQPLTVKLAYTGTATPGGDYASLPETYTFAVGSANGSITLATTDDTAFEANETVIATVAADGAYVVGASSSATVTVNDNDPVTPPPQQNSIYLSQLNWSSAVSPYGGAQKDRSAGGNAIRIAGVMYARGIGVHSPSDLVYNLAGSYTRFTAMVGIDDEVGNAPSDGTAVFQVFGDGRLLKQSTRRTGAVGAEYLDVDVTGVQQLRLVTTTGGDNDYKDHADWADAKLHFGAVAAKPVVAIFASKTTLNEDAIDRITLRFTRTGDTSESLRIKLSFSGQAELGKDYLFPIDILIPAGQSETTMNITPYRDELYEGDEPARIAIAADDAYTIGTSSHVDFTVIDDDAAPQLPVVSVTALEQTLDESDGSDSVTFRFTRTGDTSQSLRVYLDFGGDAVAGRDFFMLSEALFDAGQSETELKMYPYRDELHEPDELARIEVRPDATYSLGSASSAQITILDDDPPPSVQPKYLSDLTPTRAVSPFGGLQRDKSTGGNPIRIGGQTYAKGLGTHSRSEVEYALGGKFTRFTALVGIDDETGNAATDGSAVFEVYADGKLLKSSARRTGADAAESLDVDITGVQTLRLVTTTGGDNDYKDHTDWAEAKVS